MNNIGYFFEIVYSTDTPLLLDWREHKNGRHVECGSAILHDLKWQLLWLASVSGISLEEEDHDDNAYMLEVDVVSKLCG